MCATADEYDYDDGLIDDSELVAKFTSRAIAKHKHKKQRNEGSGFYMTHNDSDDDLEEDEDQDEGDQADQEGDQNEENLGDDEAAGGMSVADDEPVHFDESSGLRPPSGERQTLSQKRARVHNKCSNCGQHGHNKRRCGEGGGGQAVEGAQNTGKRNQNTRLVRLVRLKPLAKTSRHPLLVQLQVESSLRTIFRRLANLTWDQLLANGFQPRLRALFLLVIMGL